MPIPEFENRCVLSSTRVRAGWLLAAALAFWPCVTSAEPRGDVPVAHAVATPAPPIIDGRLDDPIWQTAPKNRGFIERKPQLRGAPPVDTWFAVAFDADALYIAVWCGDDQPAAIKARSSTRDSFSVFSDDAISIKLDPTHDRRTTVGLVMNPVGARLDYRGVNEKDFRREFDTVWRGKAAIVGAGWGAEFAVPWTSLGIDVRQPPERIGLNLSRDHPRRNATYDWALMPPPYSPVSASLYGHLDGLERLAALTNKPGGGVDAAGQGGSGGRTISLIPYVRTGFVDEGGRKRSDARGLDVLMRSGGARTRLTVNTDFSQVDVDDQVLNLTRFDLFMPEKREFFVRDVDLFSFGRSGRAQGFYSRRIGLDAQWAPVPIIAGVKDVRAFGRTQTGVIAVQTAGPADSALRLRGGDTNVVVRPLHRFIGGSTIGGLATMSRRGGGALNATVGADVTLRGREQPLLVEASAVASTDRDRGVGADGAVLEDQLAGGGTLDVTWRGLVWRPWLGYSFFGRDFRSELGFYRRVGVHRLDGGLVYEPRLKGTLEKLTVDTWTSGILRPAGSVLDAGVGNETTLTWKAGWWMSVTGDATRLTVQQPFNVGGDALIVPGEYDDSRVGFGLGSPWVRTVGTSLRVHRQRFFGGTMLQASPSLIIRPGGLLRIEAGAALQSVDVPVVGGQFVSVLINGRAAIGFSPDLNLDLYAGWSRVTSRIPIQARLRWTWRRASDVFLVYQANLVDDDASVAFQSLQVKVTLRYP